MDKKIEKKILAKVLEKSVKDFKASRIKKIPKGWLNESRKRLEREGSKLDKK